MGRSGDSALRYLSARSDAPHELGRRVSNGWLFRSHSTYLAHGEQEWIVHLTDHGPENADLLSSAVPMYTLTWAARSQSFNQKEYSCA